MTIEILIDSPQNRNLHFKPLQRTLRGTYDLNRVPEPLARMKVAEFPRPIPGLRIAVDAEKKTATITDPIYEPEHKALREQIEAKGLKLGPAVERFDGIDANTWLFWMRRAVASGACKIVSGTFPAIDEKAARKDFVNTPRTDPRDDLINKLIAIAFAGLSPERRKEVAALVGE